MSRLIDLIKESVDVEIDKIKKGKKETNKVSKKSKSSKKDDGDRIHPKYDNDELKEIVRGIGLTLDEYKKILDKVNSRNISDEEAEKMTHREYELKKYGGIVRPDGKSFMIPGLQVGSENYVYQYAHFMGILVKNPERFLKILNWE